MRGRKGFRPKRFKHKRKFARSKRYRRSGSRPGRGGYRL